MAVPVEEAVLNALRGHLSENTKLPAPLIIKVYVAALKKDFREERKVLLELIGPELQSIYDDRQIEVEIIDMHFGTGPDEMETMSELDPYVIDDHLHEIEICSRVSKSIFFIALVGSNIGKTKIPTKLDSEVFNALLDNASSENRTIINDWYTSNTKSKDYELRQDYRNENRLLWLKKADNLRNAIVCTSNQILQSMQHKQQLCNKIESIKCTTLELEINKALEYSSNNILAVFREWSNDSAERMNKESRDRAQQIKKRLTSCLSLENHAFFFKNNLCMNKCII